MAVVTTHAFPALLKGGFVGVDVFFVISGYLISLIVFSRALYGRLQEYKTFLMRGKGVASLYTACFCRL